MFRTSLLKRSASIATAASLVAVGSVSAQQTYCFSFDDALGTIPGTIQGEIEFDFLTSPTDSGIGPASRIEITSTPAGIPASSEGNVVTDWAIQAMNTFTIVNGVITDYQFSAAEGVVPTWDDNVMCLNNGGFFIVYPGVWICGPGENYFGDATSYVYNLGGIGAVSFDLKLPDIPVTIDIKPGSFPNSNQPGLEGQPCQ